MQGLSIVGLKEDKTLANVFKIWHWYLRIILLEELQCPEIVTMVAVFKLGSSEFWGSETIQLRVVYLSICQKEGWDESNQNRQAGMDAFIGNLRKICLKIVWATKTKNKTKQRTNVHPFIKFYRTS